MFQPGSVIAGRYQVVRLVGQGGMSNLYLAYDRKYNGATVVIKEMTASYSDPKEQQMAVDLFHREAKLLASLNHRHIPKVYDYFQFAGKYYLSMEFIDGEDLAQKLEASKGPLEERQVLEWGEQIATVLFYLHKHDPPIVFRDVKPSNIMLCAEGVKLIDFGIARHFDQAKKGDTMRIGSPGYAPPEQYSAQTDPRSDIYALGVTLHHALTGRDPTTTSTPFFVPPARKLNPKLSEATAEILSRATQIDPSDRYQNVLDMKKDIKRFLKGGQQPAAQAAKSPAQTSPAAAPTAKAASASAAASAPASKDAKQAPATGAAAPAQSQTAASAQSATAQGSGSLAAPSATPNQAASGGLPTNPNPTAAKKKKKKSKVPKSLLLVALVCLLGGGGFALADEAQRESALTWARNWGESLFSDIGVGNGPEDRLSRALLAGDPAALLPMFGSDDLTGLSEEKQALFRLNLLAAGAGEGPLRVVHLLYPENLKDQEAESVLWRGATRAISAVNGQGGLGRELLVILPQTYSEGGLDFSINRLSKSKEAASFLVVGGPSESLSPESTANVFRLTGPDVPFDTRSLPQLPAGETDFEKLFACPELEQAESLLWSLGGASPGAAESVEAPKSGSELEELLKRADQENAELVLALPTLRELGSTSQAGKVLLLAASDANLPALGLSVSGRALVLESSFQSPTADVVLRPRGPASITEARVVDACLLATLDPSKSYQGMTIKRDGDGKLTVNKPTLYRWTKNGWLPSMGDK